VYIADYVSEQTTEAEEFFHDPSQWLSNHYSDYAELPTHLIMFDSLFSVRFFYMLLISC